MNKPSETANAVIATINSAPSLGDAYIGCLRLFTSLGTDTTTAVRHACYSHENKLEWVTYSRHQAACAVAAVIDQLRQLPLAPGDAVAVIANTRPEWCFVDLALVTFGAVIVPIYPTLTPDETLFIATDARVVAVICENQELAAKVRPYFAATNRQERLLTIEEVPGSPRLSLSLTSGLEPLGIIASAADSAARQRQDLASIVYTSGTTGRPKGVVQSHGNYLANVIQAIEADVFPLHGSLFLYLPLAHSFARLIHYLGALTPAQLDFPSVADRRTCKLDLTAVAREIRASSVDVLPSVPRLFEKVAQRLEAAMAEPGLRGKLLRTAERVGLAKARFMDGEGPPPGLLDSLLYVGLAPLRRKIKRQTFGASLRHCISGGSRLPPEVARRLGAFGIEILEGYGLTETCVATHVNRPGQRRIGTVGLPLNRVETRIGDDGEVFLRGPNVTTGYWERPSETAASFSADGWFATGDLGTIDEKGFLTITGRKKEIVALATGKKVVPAKVEALLTSITGVTHAVVFGDDAPYCVAVLFVDLQVVKAQHRDFDTDDANAALRLRELFAPLVGMVNAQLAPFEQVRDMVIATTEPTVENGLLTPTLKIRRHAVFADYRERLNDLYRSKSPAETPSKQP